MFKKFLFISIAAVLFTALFPLNTYAAQFHTGEYTLETESVIDDDLYVVGDRIIIKGVVDGDLAVFGENISIDGTISGNLYAFGTTVDIAGSIYGDVFAFGSDVTIEGTLGQNAYIAGMMSNVNADIAKDLNIASGVADISGSVGDDSRVAAGQLSSEASVTGDFLAYTDNYTIDEDKVSGEVVLSSMQESEEKPVFQFNKDDLFGFNLGLTMVGFVGMYLVGALLIYAAPVKTFQIGNKVTESWKDFFKSFAIGLVILIAIPVPLFILTLTLVGAPLALLITGILIFIATFGTLWTETAVGHKVLSLFKYQDNQRFLSLLIGRLITVIIKLIPFINTFYMMILSVTTVGAVVRAKYDALGAAKSKNK